MSVGGKAGGTWKELDHGLPPSLPISSQGQQDPDLTWSFSVCTRAAARTDTGCLGLTIAVASWVEVLGFWSQQRVVEYSADSLTTQGLEVLLGTRKTGWNSPAYLRPARSWQHCPIPMSWASSLGPKLKIWVEEQEHRALR